MLLSWQQLTGNVIKSACTALNLVKILRKSIAAEDSIFDRHGNMTSECHISLVLPLSYITGKTHADTSENIYH